MAMIPREIVEDVRDRTDIVHLIESYLPLQKKGRNYWGLCPFHLEDTPSFSVSAEKQMYYCFGCHQGGNVIHFVMEYEHLTFPEAVRKLGERAGIPVPSEEMSPAQKKYYDERRRLFQVNEKAIVYFREQLENDAHCREYLRKRGINREMINKFCLGYAPDTWDGLKNYLKQQQVGDLDMVKAGVVSKTDNGRIFDRFRGRLMFPIFDVKGNPIAFVGRVLADGDKAKYVNTEGTSIYHKGKTLYALNWAATAIRNSNAAVLMEGNFDVISAHQFGVENAIAPQGTALTEDQAKTIWQYAKTIYLAYDSDNAGRKAALKNMDILIKQGFRVYVMTMPANLDPDDVFHKQGPEVWRQLQEESLPYMAYKIKVAREQYDIHTAEGKADALKELVPSLLSLTNIVERSDYIRQIAEELTIDENLLYMDIRRQLAQGSRSTVGQGINLTSPQDKGLLAAKEYLLRCAIENERIYTDIETNEGWDFLNNPAQQGIIKLIREHKEVYKWDFRDLLDYAEAELKPVILGLAMDDSPLMAANNEAMFQDSRKRVRKESLEKQLKAITEQLKSCQNLGDSPEEKRIFMEFDKIQKELRELS